VFERFYYLPSGLTTTLNKQNARKLDPNHHQHHHYRLTEIFCSSIPTYHKSKCGEFAARYKEKVPDEENKIKINKFQQVTVAKCSAFMLLSQVKAQFYCH
jgi:hypothetical protein